ncbi:MAG: family 78 glycoside hydrolase catalytic domain [Clostridia bacterium]|nr:family 78 glycoside hydrolase catalytic domain [Clostridia bacterium]
MLFSIDRITVDHDVRPLVLTDAERPMLAWSAKSERDGAYQSAYRLTVIEQGSGTLLWDSGRVSTAEQSVRYGGAALTSGEICTVTLVLWDDAGAESAPKTACFRYLAPRDFTGKWITTADADGEDRRAKYFYKGFTLTELPMRATLYASGLGYQYLTVNGVDVERSFLNPATSNYKKICYYTVTDVSATLCLGRNAIFSVVGNGWRNTYGFYNSTKKRLGDACFFSGDTRFIAELELIYADGRRETVVTDTSWYGGHGAITENSVFNGEVYDARLAIPLWDDPAFDGTGLSPVALAKGEVGRLIPQTLPPVTEQRRIAARTVFRLEDGAYILDFGENIAGVGAFRLPEGLPVGTEIRIEYAEELLPSGDLSRATLRSAKAADLFIVGETNPKEWIPRLTYHGFRYAKITGLPSRPAADTLTAIVFCNDVKNASFFRCGDPLVTQLHENIVRTEMGNLHHLATDCPQRDERMGWMNDATVRFEESPYNFRMGQMFRKITRDMVVEQDPETGGIPDTAPLVFGSNPADPVCSSFLVMGLETALHYGDMETIRENYEAYKRWNECLASLRTEEGIVEYSLYGDWAGPADYCKDNQHRGVQSAVTPNALMSTGFHFYNYKLLARFAELLGKYDERDSFLSEAETVRAAFLKKWFYEKHGCCVATGSQGAQAFALQIGILPKECERIAAKRMYEAVKNVGFRLTTGNITTKYLIDMLAKYGYADAAWKLLSRKEYPSWGYMIEHGATTVWERFEQKYDASMNSHNHPMYGAVGYFFYAHLLGVRPTDYGFARFTVDPVFPEGLMYAEGKVDTEMGEIYVKWQRDIGGIGLLVDVPFGATAVVTLPDGETAVSSGFHHFFIEET